MFNVQDIVLANHIMCIMFIMCIMCIIQCIFCFPFCGYFRAYNITFSSAIPNSSVCWYENEHAQVNMHFPGID